VKLRTAVAALFAVLPAAGQARAEDGVLTGTLKAIHARGTILLGVRQGAVPFSFQNKAGQPVGFSVDICRSIAADVATAVSQPLLDDDAPAWQRGLRIVFVPVTADARLQKLVAGEIDLECGSTTANAERARTIAFSPIFFLAGTRLLAPVGSKIRSWRDLTSVAVSAGTTNAAVIKSLVAGARPPVRVVETDGVAAAYDHLAAGSVDAAASDDILLAGLVALHGDRRRFGLIGDFLSFEPYAIGLRRDDPQFAALVRASFERLASDGELARRYRQWFTQRLPGGENLGLPMSAQLVEMYRALGQPD
jgi:glutamate/aspartate transport system substrate-binding protein